MDFDSQKRELAYIIDTKFGQRMWDIYTGANGNQPPTFAQILEEVTRDTAIHLLEDRLNVQDNNYWFEQVWKYDLGAAIEVLKRYGSINQPYEATYQYLHRYHLSFVSMDNGLVHAPVGKVW